MFSFLQMVPPHPEKKHDLNHASAVVKNTCSLFSHMHHPAVLTDEKYFKDNVQVWGTYLQKWCQQIFFEIYLQWKYSVLYYDDEYMLYICSNP